MNQSRHSSRLPVNVIWTRYILLLFLDIQHLFNGFWYQTFRQTFHSLVFFDIPLKNMNKWRNITLQAIQQFDHVLTKTAYISQIISIANIAFDRRKTQSRLVSYSDIILHDMCVKILQQSELWKLQVTATASCLLLDFYMVACWLKYEVWNTNITFTSPSRCTSDDGLSGSSTVTSSA